MAVVCIDIDDTLFNFGAEVREAFFELSIKKKDKSLLAGAYSGRSEWRDLSDAAETPIVLEAINLVHDRQIEQVPYKNSAITVRALDLEHTVKYVTSRMEKYQKATENWLDLHNFPEGEVICCTHDKSQHLSDAQYLIDDRPKTIVNFLSDFTWTAQRLAFGIWSPYNQNLTDLDHVYLAPTWTGIAYYLKKKGVLSD